MYDKKYMNYELYHGNKVPMYDIFETIVLWNFSCTILKKYGLCMQCMQGAN